jgi:NAD(P)H-flavin reductase
MATPGATEARAAAGPTAPRPFRVARRRRDTHDTWTLELEPVEGEPIVAAPGQFTMLYAFGIGEVPISVSGDRGGRLVHTVRAVGAVTRAICAARPGSVLGVRGPFGSEWPDAAELVVVAGGIGLAPLRLAVQRGLAGPGRVTLLYGARTPRDLLYTKELARWTERSGLRLDVTVDTAEAEWCGNVGVVPKLIVGADVDAGAAVALVCGPEVMMHFAARALLKRGLPAERIYLSMERNMRCAVAHCGHCQLGPTLICRDGAVYRYDRLEELLAVREL